MVWVVFDALFRIDMEILLLSIVFVVLLGALMFFLGRSRIFQNSPTMKTLASFGLSLFCVYGIANTRIDLENIFYRIGITGSLLYNTILAILVAFFVLSGFTRVRPNPRKKWKKRVWRLYRPLMILGSMITVVGFTSLIYEKGATITFGLITLGAGILLWFFRKKKDKIRFRRRRRRRKKEIQENQEQTHERKKRQQRLRSSGELNRKYQSYSNAVQYLQKKNKGKIPALGTHDGNLRHRYIQAMKAIEGLARQQGVRLKSVRRI